jgi:hypothetical protein
MKFNFPLEDPMLFCVCLQQFQGHIFVTVFWWPYPEEMPPGGVVVFGMN